MGSENVTNKKKRSTVSVPDTTIEKIIDLARWAPSGDNMQTWRFEVINSHHFVVHAVDTRDWCVYDLDGRASVIAFGCLLETIAIAATNFKLKATISRRAGTPENRPLFDVLLVEDETVEMSPLFPYITTRSTQRRCLSTTRLDDEAKKLLKEAVGEHFQIKWFETFSDRFSVAKLTFEFGKIRLIMPEAYPVHKNVIEKGAQFSMDKIPDQAVGLDPFSVRVMHWMMKSWKRVHFFNTYLGGTLLPRLELDLIPGIMCGAEFMIFTKDSGLTFDETLEAGRVVQRFWLTASKLGIQFQPLMTPLIFSRYIRNQISFTKEMKIEKKVTELAHQFDRLAEPYNPVQAMFMGRVGYGSNPKSRSLRYGLDILMNTSLEKCHPELRDEGVEPPR